METKKTVETDNELSLLLNDARFLLGFIWHSIKRHRRLVIVIFIAVVGLSIGLIRVLSPEYEVSARILTYPSGPLIEVRPYEGRASSPELIKSRENLKKVVKELELTKRWQSNRSTLGSLKDYILIDLLGMKKPTQEEFDGIMLDLLATKVNAWVDGNVVTIIVYWNDPETTYLIVDRLVKHFLEDQFQQENAQYIVKISNAEKRLARSEELLAAAEKRYRDSSEEEATAVSGTAQEEKTRTLSVPSATAEPAKPVTNPVMEENIDEMERELSLKRREAELLQNTYVQRVGEAKNRLAELKLTMGPQHPEVVKAERLVEILSTPPPSIEKLRVEQENLAVKIAKAKDAQASSTAAPRRRRTYATAPTQTEERSETPYVERNAKFDEYTQAKIARNTMAEELLNARIQYEAAKSALDYRYKVTQPPNVPKGPIKPKPKMIIVAAIIAGLFLGMFLAVFIDVKTGRIVESWQVSRFLRKPVLGELDEP